jgi:alkaline phosphatase
MRRARLGAAGTVLAVALAVPGAAAQPRVAGDGVAAARAVASVPAATVPPAAPRNVIFLVGDGMGFNQIDAASLYEHGVARHQVAVDPGAGCVRRLPGRSSQVYESFPVRLAAATYQDGHSYEPELAWGSFDWVRTVAADSAATATALATGVRTYNGAVGVDPDGEAVGNVTERARELGKAAGVVTSVPFTHATPAAFVAHDEHRRNYHAIGAGMLRQEDGVNVIMGAGHPRHGHDGEVLDEPVYTYLAEDDYRALAAGDTPFELVETAGEFKELASAEDPPERVVGLPRVGATLQYERSGPDRDGAGDPVEGAVPYAAPEVPGVPSLAEMTAGALNVLDHASAEGMFLLVEGGAIDWAGHDNALNRQIEEQLAFNEAVETVVDWVNRESSWRETLVVVTADHETGYLTGPGSDPAWRPLTGERGALPDAAWGTGRHTNSLVPLYAKGMGATRLSRYADQVDPVRGAYLENVEIAEAVFDQWGHPAAP